MARRAVLYLLAAALAGMLGGCGGGTSAIGVADAWARPAGTGGPGGGTTPSMSGAAATPGPDGAMPGMGGDSTGVVYLAIVNTGDGADSLTGVASDAAEAVEMHRTAIKENVASMSAVQAIAVPAHGEVRLDPGGYHLMLVGLRRALRPGDVVTLALTFARAGTIRVDARVRDQ